MAEINPIMTPLLGVFRTKGVCYFAQFHKTGCYFAPKGGCFAPKRGVISHHFAPNGVPRRPQGVENRTIFFFFFLLKADLEWIEMAP